MLMRMLASSSSSGVFMVMMMLASSSSSGVFMLIMISSFFSAVVVPMGNEQIPSSTAAQVDSIVLNAQPRS